MNWVISGIVGIMVTCLGVYFSFKYIKRKNFFNALLDFCDNLEANINFLQNGLKQILESYSNSHNTELNNLVSIMKDELNLNNKITLENWQNPTTYLKPNEREQIVSFFNKLGMTDCETQVNTIKKFRAIISMKAKNCTKDYEMKGKLYVNLSIMLGVAIFIILL